MEMQLESLERRQAAKNEINWVTAIFMALFHVGAIAALILYPLDSIIRVLGEDKLASLPIGVIWTAVFIGYLLACAHIWRSALDSGLLLGVAISLGYFVLSLSIEHRLLAQS